jgi:polyisoprenoid-binding protein YceI
MSTIGQTRAWQIDASHTLVEFGVRHLMISTVRGRFGRVAGTFRVPAGAGFEAAEVEATIDVESLDTREPQRDAHLRSADFFDAAHFPVITFKSRRVDARSGDRFALIGDLTIRGITQEITLDVTVEGRGRDPWGNDRIGFHLAGAINRKDFGLTYNLVLETGGVLVGDDVRITIDTEIVTAAQAAA